MKRVHASSSALAAKILRNDGDAIRTVELIADCATAVMDFRVFAESPAAKARMSKAYKCGERLPRMKWRGVLRELLPTLQAANQRGFGIYYSLNCSDGRGVKNANIMAVRALPLDLDDAAPPDYWGQLEPHLIIQSSARRYQAVFMVEETTNFEKAAAMAKRLALKFDGDPTVSDRARVFRLPGFFHQKAKPFMSRIVTIDHFARRYKLEELDEMLPLLPRRFTTTNDMGVGSIGVREATLLFANMDVECLNGNANWQRFAMALHSACNADEEVAELFFNFCSTATGYGDEATETRNRVRWDTFDASKEGGVGIGTLKRMCTEFRVPGTIRFQIFNTAKQDFDDV